MPKHFPYKGNCKLKRISRWFLPDVPATGDSDLTCIIPGIEQKEPLPTNFMRRMCLCAYMFVFLYFPKNVKVICSIFNYLLYRELMVLYVYIYTFIGVYTHKYTTCVCMNMHCLGTIYCMRVCVCAHLHVHAWPYARCCCPEIKRNSPFNKGHPD